MGIPNLRAIRDWCKESFLSKQEILDSKDSIESNEESGKLADALVIKEVFQSVSNGKELLASAITDKGIEADAGDTFAEMADKITQIDSSDGTGGGGNGLPSPLVFRLNIPSTTFMDNTNPTINYYFPEIPVENIEKVVLKTLSMSGKRNSATTYAQNIYFYVYTSSSVYYKALSYPSGSTSATTVTDSNVEIDLKGNPLTRMYARLSSGSSNTSYYRTASVNAVLEVYLKE